MRASTALRRVRPLRLAIVAVTATGAVVIGAALTSQAFASEPPRLTRAGSVTTLSAEATVRLSCPRGYKATGVSASLEGFESVTISGLVPEGRHAYARASATRPVTTPWTMWARAVCVRATADVQHVAQTQAAPGMAMITCPSGKELIGLGWSVRGGARIAFAVPMAGAGGIPPGTGTGGFPTGTGGFPTGTGGFPTGTGGFPTGTGGFPTGTGGFPTGTGGSGTGGTTPGVFISGVLAAAAGPSTGGAEAELSATAVCATPGHYSQMVTAPGSVRPDGAYEATGSCPRGTYAQASGLTVDSHELGEVRAQTITRNRRSGRLVVNHQNLTGLHLLCAR